MYRKYIVTFIWWVSEKWGRNYLELKCLANDNGSGSNLDPFEPVSLCVVWDNVYLLYYICEVVVNNVFCFRRWSSGAVSCWRGPHWLDQSLPSHPPRPPCCSEPSARQQLPSYFPQTQTHSHRRLQGAFDKFVRFSLSWRWTLMFFLYR